MVSSGVLRAAVSVGLAGALVLGASACGGGSKKSKMTPPPDPVTMALQAPGVRTVLIPKQSSDLTIIVPPCGLAKVEQETTETPPGSNQILVPNSALDQTVAIQPCMQGAKTEGDSTTVLLSPGGAGSASSPQSTQPPPNQLILPEDSKISKIIVPPCVVLTSTSGTSPAQSGGPGAVLPAAEDNKAVTAPPCSVQMTSSS